MKHGSIKAARLVGCPRDTNSRSLSTRMRYGSPGRDPIVTPIT